MKNVKKGVKSSRFICACNGDAGYFFTTKYLLTFGAIYFVVDYLMNGNNAAMAFLGAAIAIIVMKAFYLLCGKWLNRGCDEAGKQEGKSK
jgi:hypothetical protein